MVRSDVPLPKSCVIRVGRLSINNIDGGGADLASCHCETCAGGALFWEGERCSPRRYELVSEDESVPEEESESDFAAARWAAPDMCVSNPCVGGAKTGISD